MENRDRKFCWQQVTVKTLPPISPGGRTIRNVDRFAAERRKGEHRHRLRPPFSLFFQYLNVSERYELLSPIHSPAASAKGFSPPLESYSRMKLYLADDIYDFQSRQTLPTFILSLLKFAAVASAVSSPTPTPVFHRFVFRAPIRWRRCSRRLERCTQEMGRVQSPGGGNASIFNWKSFNATVNYFVPTVFMNTS